MLWRAGEKRPSPYAIRSLLLTWSGGTVQVEYIVQILAKGQARFEAEIAAALEPFMQDGVLQEQIVARASIFGRR